MNERGFTLIELIGTIIIVGLMVLIIVPTVNKVIKSSQIFSDKQLDDNLIIAAKSWVSDHKAELPKINGWSYNIQLSKLKEEGYLDNELKKPSTGEDYGDRCIQITNISKVPKPIYQYTLADTICKMPIVDFSMTLKGKTADHPDLESGMWTNQNVTLYAINESGRSISGNNYSYEWYLNNDSVADKITKSNERLIKVAGNSSGIFNYRVKMNTGTSITQASNEYNVRIDKKAPTISATFAKYQNVVTLSFSDNGDSGLKAGQTIYYGFSTSRSDVPTNYYNIDASNASGDQTVSVVLSGDRIKKLATERYYLWIKEGFSDVAGNKAQNINLGRLPIDNTNPNVPTVNLYKWVNNSTTPSSESGLSGYSNDTWYNGKVFTKAISNDTGTVQSGISYYQYVTTGQTSNQTVNSQTRNIEDEGVSYIKYRVCDVAGNCSDFSENKIIKLDRTPPKCTASGGGTNWQRTNVTLTGTCSDPNASNGAAGSQCKQATYTKSITSTINNTNYTFQTAYDNANNSVSCVTSIRADDCTKYTEKVTSSTSCTKKCGSGTKTDTYTRYSSAGSGFTCGTWNKPNVACNTQGCCSSVRYVDGSSCTKSCGGGTKNRIAYSNYDGSRCSANDLSSGGSSCNTHACETWVYTCRVGYTCIHGWAGFDCSWVVGHRTAFTVNGSSNGFYYITGGAGHEGHWVKMGCVSTDYNAGDCVDSCSG